MKIKDITVWEWVIGVGLFAFMISYLIWGYHIERYEKFIRAGGANRVIWRALNARALGITGPLGGFSDLKLGIPALPERCKKPLKHIDFPSQCRIFDENNGGKAINCSYWWLGRNCRIVYISEEVYLKQELKNPIRRSLQDPCRTLADPAVVKSDNLPTRQITANFWSDFGCNSWGTVWPVETLIYIRKKNKTVQIERVVKR